MLRLNTSLCNILFPIFYFRVIQADNLKEEAASKYSMTTLRLSHQRRAAPTAAQLGLSVLCSSELGQTNWCIALKGFFVVPKVVVEVKLLSTTGPGKRISSQQGDVGMVQKDVCSPQILRGLCRCPEETR